LFFSTKNVDDTSCFAKPKLKGFRANHRLFTFLEGFRRGYVTFLDGFGRGYVTFVDGFGRGYVTFLDGSLEVANVRLPLSNVGPRPPIENEIKIQKYKIY